MSYEGSRIMLCAAGHRRECDAYEDEDVKVCRCGQPIVWHYEIDTTNGYEPEHDPKLTVRTPAVTETCNLGCRHIVQEATYYVPGTEPKA